MRYKLSLVAISLLALNLNAGGVADCDKSNPTKECGVDFLEQDQVITNQYVRISGTHNVNSIKVTGEKDSSGAYKYKFDQSGTTTVKDLTINTVDAENWETLKAEKVSIVDSTYTQAQGSTSITTAELTNSSYNNKGTSNITNLTMTNSSLTSNRSIGITNLTLKDNSTYTNTFGDNNKVTNLTVENGATIEAKAGHIRIDNILETNNLKANITLGGLTIKNIQASAPTSISPVFDISGGVLNFSDGVVNNVTVNANGGLTYLKGNAVLNNSVIKKTSAAHTSHNIVISNDSNVNIINTTLENLSINANSKDDTNGRLTIKGGTMTNTGIGTQSVKDPTNLAYLTLDNVAVNNETMTGDNIIAQHVVVQNYQNTTNFQANVNAKDDISIVSSTFAANSTNSFISKNINVQSSELSGKITASEILATSGSKFDTNSIVSTKLLNDTGSAFSGKVTLDCTGDSCGTTNPLLSVANGSTFADLTLNNDAKLLLDKGSSVTNLTLSTQNNYVAINGDSSVTGIIKNEGVIEVFKGTVSNNITGKGDLITHGATYTGDVNLSDVIGSGSTFNGTVKATDSMEVDNGTFNGVVKVEDATNKNATLYAYQGNTFKADVTADNAILSYDATKDVSKGKKITLDTNLTTNNALTIKDLTVTAKALKSNTANISNATISSKLVDKGFVDTAKIYDKDITAGSKHTITNSDITGGVRVDELNISGSQIKSQVAVNTLNATNNTFYVFGGGLDTSFYTDYSGAIIVRKGAVGSGNTIQLSNTNLGMLTNGYVPIAIVKDETVANASTTPPANGGGNGGGANPITSIANPSKVAGGGIGKDFFKVAYKTKIADYELADQFLTYQEKDGRYVWSVGVAGKNMVDVASVDNIVDGTDTANIANGSKETAKVDYTKIIVDIGDMFNFKGFDQTAVESAKFIVASPEYLARTKLDIPYNRYKAFKSNHKDNGIWMNNKNGYNKYTSSSIHHTDINIGADKVTEISNSSLMLGLAINLSSSNTKGNVISDATSKGIGIYAMNKFDNNAFVGLETFYHNIDTTYEAKSLGVNTSKHHNVYTASIIAGQRLGEKVYVEPSLKYDMITYKPSKINGEGISIEGDRQIIHTLGVNVEVGTNVANQLDAYAALGYAKELTDKEDLYIKDEVRPHTVKGEKGDDSIRANLGLNYNISPKATLNADFGYNKYSNQGKEYKTNVGFAYRF